MAIGRVELDDLICSARAATGEELFDDPTFEAVTVDAFRDVGWFDGIASTTCDDLSQEGLLRSLVNLSYYDGVNGAFGFDCELFETADHGRVQGTEQYVYQACTTVATGLCDVSGLLPAGDTRRPLDIGIGAST